MNDPLISIVVPIYEVEKYLKECVNSIICQTYSNLEIILVDDGAKGKEPEICDYYAERDPRVTVIHKKNEGLVAARKNGFAVSHGEYLATIDADDWIERDYIERIVNCLETGNEDMIITGFTYEYEKGERTIYSNKLISGVYENKALDILKNKALYSGVFYEPGIAPAFWCKLFRREILISALSNVSDCIRMGEDAAVVYPCICHSKYIRVVNELNGYHYRIVRESMSRSYDPLFFERAYRLLIGLRNDLATSGSMETTLDYYYLYIVGMGIDQVLGNQKGFFKKNDRQDLIQWFKYLEIENICKRVDYSGFARQDVVKWKLLSHHCFAFYNVCYVYKRVYNRLH